MSDSNTSYKKRGKDYPIKGGIAHFAWEVLPFAGNIRGGAGEDILPKMDARRTW